MCRSKADPHHRRCHEPATKRRARQNAAYAARTNQTSTTIGPNTIPPAPSGVTADSVAAAIRAAQAALADPAPLVATDPSRGGWTFATEHGRRVEQAVRDAGAAVAARADQLAAAQLPTVGQRPEFLAWRPEGFTSDAEWVAFVDDLYATAQASQKQLDTWWRSLDDAEQAEQAGTYLSLKDAVADKSRPIAAEQARIKQGESAYLKAEAAVRADAYRAALAEHRSLGPVNGMIPVHRDSSPDAVGRLQEALGSYPTSWIDADQHHVQQGSPAVGKVPLLVRDAKKRTKTVGMFGTKVAYSERAYYSQTAVVDVTGDGSETATKTIAATSRLPKGGQVVREYWGVKRGRRVAEITDPRPADIDAGRVTRWRDVEVSSATVKQPTVVSELVIDAAPHGGVPRGVSTALHEYGHRAEKVNPTINEVAQAFLARRTTTTGGDREPLSGYHTTTAQPPATADGLRIRVASSSTTPEYVRPDGFADAYMGKQYAHEGASEVFTTGMEGVFAGRFGGLIGTGGHRADHEHRDLILGILATV